MVNKTTREQSSFRDPSGFIYYKQEEIHRQINQSYKQEYDHLISSGLYALLEKEKLLISHKEVDIKPENLGLYKTIMPIKIPFISYPYEWSFSQLKDAAILTLKVLKISLEHGMVLKDASAYNVQFFEGRPIFIDTLSFERYIDDQPWVAYKQFCQHFLAPLFLMSYTDIRLSQLLKVYIDGIPLDLACKLLPKRALLNLSVLSHIYFHSRAQQSFLKKTNTINRYKLSKRHLLLLIDNLITSIDKLALNKINTEWSDYYTFTNYSKESIEDKGRIIRQFIKDLKPEKIWDLGANDARFSSICSKLKIHTIAFDIDPLVVEKSYLNVKKNGDRFLLPLLMDLANPSSDSGWANMERASFTRRAQNATIMALALIHHLAITYNLPFIQIASLFKGLGDNLIVEFIPKEDSQLQKMLSNRVDIFSNYCQREFEVSFKKYFKIKQVIQIKNSKRFLYLMGL